METDTEKSLRLTGIENKTKKSENLKPSSDAHFPRTMTDFFLESPVGRRQDGQIVPLKNELRGPVTDFIAEEAD